MKRNMDTNSSKALIVLVLSKHKETLIRLILVSQDSYSTLLQEAMGLGQSFLKNEIGAVRVEIYNELSHPSKKPIVVLTKDDLLQEKQKQPAMRTGWLWWLVRRFSFLT